MIRAAEPYGPLKVKVREGCNLEYNKIVLYRGPAGNELARIHNQITTTHPKKERRQKSHNIEIDFWSALNEFPDVLFLQNLARDKLEEVWCRTTGKFD